MSAVTIHSGFIDLLGIELVRAEDGASELRLPLAPKHLNSWEVMHGGVTMALLDVALSTASRSVAPEGTGVVTIEMKTSFMQPGSGEMRAYGRLLHRSTTMAYCEGEVRDANGKLVAKAMGTFKYLRRLAVGRDVREQRRPSEPRGD
ncbi:MULTISPECIES: PaaI family thioesterase [Pandoraea]|uniref:Phenylacetic acid degradation protein n=1 Tax=Pandoraea pnomenusa TaxID=93220 RepID=A0A378YD43_9BURK|nr:MULTISPECIES: PaaI family thioesterase [Pandoraea]AHB05754.1 phenylacetic acid degradation protein [Pandoraea pnomenusa 3kgm]AHB78178.2 phenylacetic acid degradation protein [Pandoraea pnomenusa]AHN73525.2 phenylacetic acid degradation protein [Pandoraea pnomenusa]AIU25703.1 phenylacetic acid degradation protein [Pandoraea pnomenusa]ANC46835.1 phenylacetic acid degradation protein [Pandoraea pnomenusa]